MVLLSAICAIVAKVATNVVSVKMMCVVVVARRNENEYRRRMDYRFAQTFARTYEKNEN